MHPTAILIAAAAVLGLSALLPHGTVHAAEPLGPDARLCGQQTARQGQLGGIPNDLLTAISRVESGRWDSGQRAKVAWPWTVMAEGDGKFFPTRDEAIREVRRLQARGVRSIDVGCMQINLMYHADAFPNLEAAFDPATNAAYAVEFLQGLYRETGAWMTAATRYHSATPEYANRYRRKIVAELDDMQENGTGITTQMASAVGFPAPSRTTAPSAGQIAAIAERTARMETARAETEAQRNAAKAYAENWRAQRLADYLKARRTPLTGSEDAS